MEPFHTPVDDVETSSKQGCGVGAGVVRSRRSLGGVGFGFLTTLGVGFFVRLRLSNWIIFFT